MASGIPVTNTGREVSARSCFGFCRGAKIGFERPLLEEHWELYGVWRTAVQEPQETKQSKLIFQSTRSTLDICVGLNEPQ